MAVVLWKQFFQYQQDRYSFSMLCDLVTLAEEEESFCMLGFAWVCLGVLGLGRGLEGGVGVE